MKFRKKILPLLCLGVLIGCSSVGLASAQAAPATSPTANLRSASLVPTTLATTACGDKAHGGGYVPAIDIGCAGKGNPIADATFAIIRVLSDGVGLVVIGSIIVGGMQYSGSRGDPQSTAKAVNRIRASVFALLLYMFSYAILNYVIPGQVLK